ncbi:alpha/beta-hydrolase [Laetiporus sulphureus 93-53]|uniref:Alpha/beta-hydrolase n=1 Tax=Laetiporus sulphureus 93-53 TaxID=1314785 RepID=A0A165HSW7_9APHY|nr:alpha/beta-hydrolase [Laetiporus sulphureus 93-53]KZT12142.1 alpha/beta-hydrolase [Laetiporus sulphureus 93-53]
MYSGGEQPFTLSVADADLEVLRTKLERARLPDELDDAGWEYGAPLANVKRLLARWKDGFDWRKAETKINALPQYTRDVDVDGFGTLNIHYVHQKSSVDDAIPLLFVHGWPGHFLEVRKLLPLLTAASSDHPSFHVVAPSLPNFGFSEGVKARGFHGTHYAEAVNKLMLALGYNEYVVQGGDWGCLIARQLAANYGRQHVKAWHTNFPAVRQPPSLTQFPRLWLSYLLTPYNAAERAGLERSQWFATKGTGYSQEQSTQPQTLGYSLADSPVGLLAWIYEKLVTWTDDYPWEDDEVLTWVSVYWFSRAGPAASVRIYYEVTQANERAQIPWSSIPCGLSFFPRELLSVPKTWARTIGNVVIESEHGSGGHFAAYEKPEELAADIRAMFGKGGPAFGVVGGKAGYVSGYV